MRPSPKLPIKRSPLNFPKSARGHPIVHTTWIANVSPPGALLIGEAARLTHNGTGEGISQAMASGIHAAEAVARAVRGEATESVARRGYLLALRRRFTAEFAAGHLLRDLVSSGTFDGLVRAYNMLSFRRAIDWAVGAVMPALTRQEGTRPPGRGRGQARAAADPRSTRA